MDPSKLTVVQLKKMLRDNNIKPLTGSKAVLVKRIMDNNIYENHIKDIPHNNIYKMDYLTELKDKLTKELDDKKKRNADELIEKTAEKMALLKKLEDQNKVHAEKMLEKQKIIDEKQKIIDEKKKQLNEASKPKRGKIHEIKFEATMRPSRRQPKQISVKDYFKIMNYLFVEGGYKLSPTKTIEHTTNVATASYYLEQLFPDIIKYNVYSLTKQNVYFILDTITNYIDTLQRDEYDAIIDKLNINQITRSMPSKAKSKLLPPLENIDDIRSALSYTVSNYKEREQQPIDYYSLSVKQLKEILKYYKLKLSGKKQDLADRIIAHMLKITEYKYNESKYKVPVNDQESDTQSVVEEEQIPVEVFYDEEPEYPEITMSDMIIHQKPSHTKLLKKMIPQKMFQDELEFYDQIDALPKPVKKQRIPKYVPPQPYVTQKDFYDGYKTYGEYNDRELVFKNATDYVDDLKTIRDFSKIINIEEFKSEIKNQIKKLDQPIMLSYLDTMIVPISKHHYELQYLTNQSDTTEYDQVDTLVQAIDAVSDIIARSQFSLESERFKQLLNDILTIIDPKSTKSDKLNIVKNYYIKYKYISSPKIKDLIQEYDVTSVQDLILQGDEYIREKQEEAEQREHEKRVQEDNKQYEKMRREDQARRKKQEEDDEREINRIKRERDREEERESQRSKR